MHVHRTRLMSRIGTYEDRTCRCGAVQCVHRSGRGDVLWASSWSLSPYAVAQAVHQHAETPPDSGDLVPPWPASILGVTVLAAGLAAVAAVWARLHGGWPW